MNNDIKEKFEQLKRYSACSRCQYCIDKICNIPNDEECVWKELEQELNKAEENEKLLNVFKNALTIEHHECPMIKVEEHDDTKDTIDCIVQQLYTIKQNQMDKSMRKSLRDWVLKNAFPKEMQVLDLIKDNFKISFYHSRHTETGYEMSIEDTDGNIIFNEITKEEHDLLEEAL